MTYSILAQDERTGELGVGIQSHFLGVGRLAPFAQAGVGVVATQAFVDPAYGPRALALLADGCPVQDALERLVSADANAAERQVALLDSSGRAAAYTGDACYAEASHVTDVGVSAQGNMLGGTGVPRAMVERFRAADGDLATRLLAALDAGEAAGGDARGRQSAALLVVGADRGALPTDGVLVDLRVDDAQRPLDELRRLLAMLRGYAALGEAFRPGVMTGGCVPAAAELDAALEAVDRAVTLLPGSPEPLMWRAIALARGGRGDEARAAARQAVRLSPHLGAFFARLTAQGIIEEDPCAPRG